MVRVSQALNASRRVLPFVAVSVAALFAHLPSLFNGFVWDDLTFIWRNPVLREAGNIPSLFVSPETVGTGIVNPYYRPLTTMGFLADTLLWGELPAGFHATNLLLHLGVCVLLLAVLRRLLAPGAALAAALLFAVHPANAEPVAYVSARADLICAFFLLAAFLAWLRHGETGGRGPLAFSALAYLAALLAKIAAGTYPAVFALHGLLFFKRRLRVRDLLPFAAVALGFLAVRGAVLEMDLWPQQPLLTRVATAGPVIANYLLLAVSPAHLKVFHDIPLRTAFDAPSVASWAALAGVLAIATAYARQTPRAALALAWFLAGVIPVSGLVTLLYPALAADRYLYLPLLGASIAVGALVQHLSVLRLPAPRRRLVAGAAALALLTLAGFTMSRGRIWRDRVTLWERAALDSPRNTYVLNALASAYTAVERDEEALWTLLKSLALDEVKPDTHLKLANLALLRNDFAAAEWHAFRVLEIVPGSVRAYRCLDRIARQMEEEAARQASEGALNPGILSAATPGMPLERRPPDVGPSGAY